MKNFAALSGQLPFWHFDQNLMVFSDGSLGGGFKIEGIDTSCATTSEKNDFCFALKNLLSGLPDGLRLQVFYSLGSSVNEKLLEHEALSQDKDSESYSKIKAARIENLRDRQSQLCFAKPEIYLFLRSRGHLLKKKSFLEVEQKFTRILEEDYQAHAERFSRPLSQLKSLLSASGFRPQELTSQQWFWLCFKYLNLDQNERVGPPNLQSGGALFPTTLSEQLVSTDIEVHGSHLKIGRYFFRVLTLKDLPEGQSHTGMIKILTRLPFHFWLSQNIEILDQSKETLKLNIERRLTHSMASGSGNLSDLQSESKLSHLEDLLSELIEGSEKVMSSDLNLVVWAETTQNLEDKTDAALSAFKEMNQSQGLVESLPGFDAFLRAMPGTCLGFRHKKMKTSNVSHLMPLYSSWEGNRKPTCLIPNREGSLVAIDPFDAGLLNWNGLVFGGSGSGKSFSLCQLMLMFYGQTPRPKIVWIDNGASSQRLLEVLGGEFIDLGIDSQICLNLFDLPPGEVAPQPSKVKLILAVLETLLKDEEKRGIGKREKALLEEAIFAVYLEAKGRVPILSDLKELLAGHEVPEMKAFSQILYSWTGATAYGRLLDGPTNVELAKDLVTIEMKGLDTYPDLQNIFMLLFTDAIKMQASLSTAQPFILIIDEAWKLFETPSGLSFTAECYRTFRKFRSSIICVSQNYRDFLADEKVKQALFPNTSTLLILRQQAPDWADFKACLSLNDTEVELFKSIEVVKGKYSEMFLRQGENRSLLRLSPDPLSYWICTSDPVDKTRIADTEKEFPSLSKLEVLERLSRETLEGGDK